MLIASLASKLDLDGKFLQHTIPDSIAMILTLVNYFISFVQYIINYPALDDCYVNIICR